MTMKIKVGVELINPRELGFDKVENIIHSNTIPFVQTIILSRHNVPLVVTRFIYPLFNLRYCDEFDYNCNGINMITLKEIVENGKTPDHDYPTKPWIETLRILRQQLERIDLQLHEVERIKEDLAAIAKFALERRGEYRSIGEILELFAFEEWKELKEILEYIEEKEPYRGNRKYIEIAKEAFELLKLAFKLGEKLEELECEPIEEDSDEIE